MRPVHQKRLGALRRRRDFLANRIEEGEENSHDLREHLALVWAIGVIEQAAETGRLEALDVLTRASSG